VCLERGTGQKGGRREVILAPALAKSPRERWLASRRKGPRDFVFGNTLAVASTTATSAKRSDKLSNSQAPAAAKLTLHSLRHTFASLLIARRLDVVFVSRQLGHANPSITLGVYAYLYARADDAEAARDAIEASHAAMTSSR
jgi:integrase